MKIVFVLTLFVLTTTALGQDGGSISGRVIDEEKPGPDNGIPGVNIKLLGSDEKIGETVGDGTFDLQDIPLGEQTFEFSLDGYRPVKVTRQKTIVSGKNVIEQIEMWKYFEGNHIDLAHDMIANINRADDKGAAISIEWARAQASGLPPESLKQLAIILNDADTLAFNSFEPMNRYLRVDDDQIRTARRVVFKAMNGEETLPTFDACSSKAEMSLWSDMIVSIYLDPSISDAKKTELELQVGQRWRESAAWRTLGNWYSHPIDGWPGGAASADNKDSLLDSIQKSYSLEAGDLMIDRR